MCKFTGIFVSAVTACDKFLCCYYETCLCRKAGSVQNPEGFQNENSMNFKRPAWGFQMPVIVVLAKVPVNCSLEGVVLQMALGVTNATKEPSAICGFTRDGFRRYQRNQGAGCNLRLHSGWL